MLAPGSNSRRFYFLLPHLLCLLLSGGSAKKVKINLEPFVDAGVNSMVLVTDLLWCQALLPGLVLGSCAVLVCATHVQQVPASQAAIPERRLIDEEKKMQ